MKYTVSLLGVLMVACSPSSNAVDASVSMDAIADDAVVDAAPERLQPPVLPRTQNESELAASRQRCAFRAGAWPAETIGREHPIGSAIPIDHILLLMQENRSFDHYFAELATHGQPEAEGPPRDWSNPRADGSRVAFRAATSFCIRDVNHEWLGAHQQYNDGRMDGFVTTNDPDGERAMEFVPASELPFYFDLANAFALGDRYFSSLLGPTFPNRLFFIAATSFGLVGEDNSLVPTDTAVNPSPQLFSSLDAAGVSWRSYADGARMLHLFPYYGIARYRTRVNYANLRQLFTDLANNTLPSVAVIEPMYTGTASDRFDEHPPGLPQVGQRWVESIVRAVMASPAWPRTALFLVYDEHGGFADHVPPPNACAPDAIAPHTSPGTPPWRFDRLGFRVPFLVVSPWAKRHYVSHQVFDHTSVLRFIQARFGLPALTARDANATPVYDLFDFQSAPRLQPPMLRTSVVDAEMQRQCAQRFP